MKEAGFKDIWTSIINRQNTVAQYIATLPLLDLCEGTNQIGGRGCQGGDGIKRGSTGIKQKQGWRRQTHRLRQTRKRRRHGAHPVEGAARVGRNGVELMSTSGMLNKLVKCYISTELSDWVSAVLGLD